MTKLLGQRYVVRISFVYDGAAGLTTARAQRVYGGGLVADCGLGVVEGLDERGAIARLRASRHETSAWAGLEAWRRARRERAAVAS